jgi:uncharacterized protein (DUF1778 family)
MTETYDVERKPQIAFRVSPEQLKEIERAAASEALPTGSFCRSLVVKHLAKQQVVAA